MSETNPHASRGPIPGFVVGQYFGLFNGVTKAHYEKIVAAAPFENCNLLILAFVHTLADGKDYVAGFNNWRDNHFPFSPDDTDQGRASLVVKTARAKNASIKILISLGWGNNDVALAASTPGPFAKSVAAIVHDYGLDGFDIDYESVGKIAVEPVLALAQELRQALDGITPKREMILTITPADKRGLDARVLQVFTYTMPQSYDHDGNGTSVDWYEKTCGSFDRIVYGLNSEGYIGDSDDPVKFADQARQNSAAGIFAWRLDNDSVDRTTSFPTFATGIKMWTLMGTAAGGR